MTDRETIIDLLQDVQAKGFWSYGTDMYTGEECGHVMTPDLIADYLMENGVKVDSEPVVRCGKCKWWDPDSEYCQFWHGLRHPEHYCGEGDKK